jgi:hypothetical protein
LTIPPLRHPERQHLWEPLLVVVVLSRDRNARQSVSGQHEPAFLPLQSGQNLSLPALLDPLDPNRRYVDRHSVFEPRAEHSMHVRMGRAVLAAVLMDCEDALCAARGTAESLFDGVAQDALRKPPVDPLEALNCGVVDSQDEAEVDGAPETAAVLTERLADGRLVAPQGTIPLTEFRGALGAARRSAPSRGARYSAPARPCASGPCDSELQRRTSQLLSPCGPVFEVPGRSRSAFAMTWSHSSAPTARTSASSSSSLTFTAPSRAAQ